MLDKESNLDVAAVGLEREKINIEIQAVNHDNFAKRALYYLAKLYREQEPKPSTFQFAYFGVR